MNEFEYEDYHTLRYNSFFFSCILQDFLKEKYPQRDLKRSELRHWMESGTGIDNDVNSPHFHPY